MATRKITIKPKKRSEWTKMEMALVWKLTNSTTLPLPGSWNSNPGEKITNRIKPIMIGAQSAIYLSL
jgi:hypothetical protein